MTDTGTAICGWEPCLKSHPCLVHNLIKLPLGWSYGKCLGNGLMPWLAWEREFEPFLPLLSPLTPCSPILGVYLPLAFVDLLYPSSTQAVSQTKGGVLLTSDPLQCLAWDGPQSCLWNYWLTTAIPPNWAEIRPEIAHLPVYPRVHPS